MRTKLRVSKTTLARWVTERGFLAPVHLGPSSPRFDAEAVQRWIDEQEGGSTISASFPTDGSEKGWHTIANERFG